MFKLVKNNSFLIKKLDLSTKDIKTFFFQKKMENYDYIYINEYYEEFKKDFNSIIQNENELKELFYNSLSKNQNFELNLFDTDFNSIFNNSYFKQKIKINLDDLNQKRILKILIEDNKLSDIAIKIIKNIFNIFSIDGTMNKNSAKQRYGIAELYVDMPGVEIAQKVSKKKKVYNACRFIIEDPRGADGRIIMAKLLGKNMRNAPDADVEDFLFQCAEKDPDKVISLYAGEDLNLRILFADAREKRVITVKNKLYIYASADVVLGHTDDAVIAWMKDAKNKKVLDLIRKDTYPEMEPKNNK